MVHADGDLVLGLEQPVQIGVLVVNTLGLV